MSATTTGELMGAQGLAKAASLDPEPISKAILGIASSIANMFAGAHIAALAKEAATLNNATPTFINEVQTVMTDLSEGGISESAAIAYLQQAQADYYTTVSGIIKKGGPCVASCVVGAQSSAGKPQGWISTEPTCCNNSGSCNASCCIGCYLVEPTVTALTKIIQAGGGSWVIPSSQNNGAIKGTPLVTITYAGRTVLSSIESKIEGVLGITPSSSNPQSGLIIFILLALAIFGVFKAIR